MTEENFNKRKKERHNLLRCQDRTNNKVSDKWSPFREKKKSLGGSL